MTTVYFIRHCRSDYTVHDDRTRPLTPEGVRDSAYVSAFLRGKNISAVYSSPYKRALDTVSPFAALAGLKVQTVEELRERESAEGWLSDIDFRELVRRQWADFSHALPDGESLKDVQLRNIGALEDILRNNDGKNIAIGTHGTALSTIINHYETSYGYDSFSEMVYIMPWAVKMEFEGMDCVSLKKINIKERFPKVIHVLGASGAGVSTLGRAIGERFGHVHLDADDFFWLPTDPPFTQKREASERVRLINEAVEGCERYIISGSMCGWGDVFIPRLELCILVETPTNKRIERLKRREHFRFGERIEQDGDMHTEHIKFLDWAARYDTGDENIRSRVLHDKWLSGVSCPIIQVDGTKPVRELLNIIGDKIYE